MELLTEEQLRFVKLVLCLTGRENRLLRKSITEPEQNRMISAIWSIFKEKGSAFDDQIKCDLMNRVLLTLGITPFSLEFCKTVFSGIDLSDLDALEKRVNMFRVISMMQYGSFRFAYKVFRSGKQILSVWDRYYPTEQEQQQRANNFTARAETVGLVEISGSELFSLGYIASNYAPKINEARTKLRSILEEAITKNVQDFQGIQAISNSRDEKNLPNLIAKTGIPNTERLLSRGLPLLETKTPIRTETFDKILTELISYCVPVDQDTIIRARESGKQNARTYMAMHDLDVYVATSMRDPLNFTTNWSFVRRLFHEGPLAAWKVHYFDPTQAYLDDRIQKGLLECLMIKRARLTIYNAQEADTFGKDAEAGVTLAQGKPVIVFVARLFENRPEFKKIYDPIDEAARQERDPFVDNLYALKLITSAQKAELALPEKTKADAVTYLVTNNAPQILERIENEIIEMELVRQGYDPERVAKGFENDIIKATTDRILLLERRALTFRDVHPLALQTSPMDGVARGVIVTRTVEDTAKVVEGLFLGTLNYEIIDDNFNWLLVDNITKSPVRVVTKDPVLTTAFWSEDWLGEQLDLGNKLHDFLA